MPSDKLTTTRPAAIEQAPELPPALKLIHQLDPDLAMRALAIMAARPGNAPLTPDRAIAAALHEIKTGQVCGRDFYADQFMGIVPGYRGIAREAKENGAGLWGDSYREFTPAEKEEHEVEQGDQAYVCELTQYKAAEAAKAAGVPYHPRLGFGIVKAAEHKKSSGAEIKLAGGYTWARKARNRALKDALRHAGLGDTAEGILEDAEAEGLPISFDPAKRQHLTLDQARQLKARAEWDAEQDARPAEVKAVEAARDAAHQRQMQYEGRMGMADRCPDCGAGLPNHLNSCEWFDFAPDENLEDIPSAREERGELTPAEMIRAKLQAISRSVTGPITDRDRAWANGSLAVLIPNEEQRHALRAYLFEVDAAAELTDGELLAIKNWVSATKLPPTQDFPKGQWIPCTQAIDEARVILAELFPSPDALQDEPEAEPAPAGEVTP